MFETLHFVWLGLMAAAIVAGLLVCKKFKPSTKTLFTIACAFCIASEVVKLFCVLIQGERVNEHGTFIKETDLPFHLCSMQIFLALLGRFTEKESVKNFCATFMVPTAILGGIAAMMIPTISTQFTNPRSYQYFIYHAALVWFGIALIVLGKVKLDLKALGQTLVGLFGAVMIGLYINGWTQCTNFLYLSAPPMDGLPVLNTDNGWFVYFLSYMGVAICIIALFFLPFIIYGKVKEKRAAAESKE